MVSGSKSAALEHNMYIILHTRIISALRQRSYREAVIPHDLQEATIFTTSHPLTTTTTTTTIIIFKHNDRLHAEDLKQKSHIIKK